MIAIAPTDPNWLSFLRGHPELTTVNFWTPTPWNVRSLSPGDTWYFLEKGGKPRRIAGYGTFARYENLRASEAWARYGIGNGAATFREKVERLSEIASTRSVTFSGSPDPEIGCIVLSDPVFLSPDECFTPESVGLSFPDQVVKWKGYDSPPVHRRATTVRNRSTDPPATGQRAGRLTTADALREALQSLNALDQIRTATQRAEQGILRSLILGSGDTATCAICGNAFPLDLVVAAHIKRRAECSDAEKVDPNNVMPVCRFGCDDLFERGYLVVANGRLVDGPRTASHATVQQKVSYLRGKPCSVWSPERRPYFDAHRERHEQGARAHASELL